MALVTWLATGLGIFLAILAALYAVLSLFLLLECLLALLPYRRSSQDSTIAKDLSLTILMPAHNEASVIAHTLNQLIPEVDTPEQIVVVADNCQDATAAIARSTGVTVLERQNRSQRGKGYALDYGLQVLAATRPDVVVIVDADCWVTAGTIHRIAQAAQQSDHPVQAVYRMEQPLEATLRDRLSAFAFIVKNRVRAGGLSQLGVPIMLGGTGMAFPWESLQSVELASGHIVEDMKLGIDLAIAGYVPTLSLESEVVGILPDDDAAATSQRTRWEHGHLQVLTTYVPKLLVQAIRQLRPDLLALALDLAIPPLALWSILGIALTGVTGIGAVAGITVLPFQVQLLADTVLVSAILLAWSVWGRRELSFSQLLAIPSYILWKIPMYLKVVLDPQKTWVRTKRNT